MNGQKPLDSAQQAEQPIDYTRYSELDPEYEGYPTKPKYPLRYYKTLKAIHGRESSS